MKWLMRFFNFYLNSSIHVALSVSALTLVTLTELQLEAATELMGFVFFGTISAYNFVKYASVAGLHHRSLTDNLRAIQVFSFLCFGAWIYFAFQIPFKILLWCLPISLLTLFYALPIAPKGTNLRTIPTLKIFIIALVWSGTSVYLPAIFSEYAIDWDLVLLFIQRSLLVLALILPFEIRDLTYDHLRLGTFPQLLGIRRTKLIGIAMLLIYFGLEFLKVDQQQILTHFRLILVAMTVLAILYAKSKQHGLWKYYASFWVEGIPILWWIIIWLSQ